jgi:peptidoglycan/LPS O-acetylase OafA/YrhL
MPDLPQRPLSLLAAAVIQGVEAAAVLGAAVLAGVDAGTGRSYHADSGVALTVIGVVTALLLGLVASGVARARRWSRTPALLTQLFVGIVSIYLIQGHRYDWGVPGLVLAVAGFVLLLIPPSMRALTSEPASPAGPGER